MMRMMMTMAVVTSCFCLLWLFSVQLSCCLVPHGAVLARSLIIRAVTDVFKISGSDCSLYIGIMQETVGQHYMKGEPATPIIDQKVVFVTIQSLPHVILKGSLLIHRNTRWRSSLQLPVHGSGLSLSLIYYHERHLRQVAAHQPATQASNLGGLRETELSAGLQ